MTDWPRCGPWRSTAGAGRASFLGWAGPTLTSNGACLRSTASWKVSTTTRRGLACRSHRPVGEQSRYLPWPSTRCALIGPVRLRNGCRLVLMGWPRRAGIYLAHWHATDPPQRAARFPHGATPSRAAACPFSRFASCPRHSASACRRALELKVANGRLGHSSIGITANLYQLRTWMPTRPNGWLRRWANEALARRIGPQIGPSALIGLAGGSPQPRI